MTAMQPSFGRITLDAAATAVRTYFAPLVYCLRGVTHFFRRLNGVTPTIVVIAGDEARELVDALRMLRHIRAALPSRFGPRKPDIGSAGQEIEPLLLRALQGEIRGIELDNIVKSLEVLSKVSSLLKSMQTDEIRIEDLKFLLLERRAADEISLNMDTSTESLPPSGRPGANAVEKPPGG